MTGILPHDYIFVRKAKARELLRFYMSIPAYGHEMTSLLVPDQNKCLFVVDTGDRVRGLAGANDGLLLNFLYHVARS